MEKAGMVIQFRHPPGKAFFPNGGKLGKRLGHPQPRFKMPQPNGPLTASKNWDLVGFPPFPQPLLRLFLFLLKIL